MNEPKEKYTCFENSGLTDKTNDSDIVPKFVGSISVVLV